MHPTTNNLQMIPARADNHRNQPSADDHRNQPPAEHIKCFLTDVLLFTHLVHLPMAYASKPILWARWFISQKGCNHLNSIGGGWLPCRQSVGGIRYLVQAWLERRYVRPTNGCRTPSASHQYISKNIFIYFCRHHRCRIFVSNNTPVRGLDSLDIVSRASRRINVSLPCGQKKSFETFGEIRKYRSSRQAR